MSDNRASRRIGTSVFKQVHSRSLVGPSDALIDDYAFTVFSSLGKFIAHRPRWIAGVWVVVALLGYVLATSTVTGESLFGRLSSGQSTISGSESAAGSQILSDNATSGEEITLLISGLAPDQADAKALSTSRAELSLLPGVDSVLDPLQLAESPAPETASTLTAAHGSGFLVVVGLQPHLDKKAAQSTALTVAARLEKLGNALTKSTPGATSSVGSSTLIVQAITDQVESDLRTGELIALPIALVVMILVFGGFLAAMMPLAGALASIGCGLGALFALSSFLDIHVTVVNVVTVLGLGLSIDYGLLIVSRFREELHRLTADPATDPWHISHADPKTGQIAMVSRHQRRPHGDPVVTQALVNTMGSAGRTVAFSSVTVAISVAGLMVFQPAILRSVGAASVCIVVIALATALTLVPALLHLAGRRMIRPGKLSRFRWASAIVTRTADVTSETGFFSRLAGRIQRHPWWVLGGSVALLSALAVPAFGMHLQNSGTNMLPVTSPQRQFLAQLADQYPAASGSQIQVVAATSLDNAKKLRTTIADLPSVSSVSEPVAMGSYSVLGVSVADADSGGRAAELAVKDIRNLKVDFPIWTTGQAAGQIDFVTALKERAGWAISLVVVATMILLFFMSGSLVIPLKALLTNALSLMATLGVLTWSFQDGHLASLLGFTSTGGLETVVVTIVIAFAYGLAMDYEVFLLARIKEAHDAEGNNTAAAVRWGLQRSGRIITSAAAVIVIVFAGFIFGDLLLIKQVGFALAVAVFLDATIVRMLLVPATMTILDKWNWWAPSSLKRLHAKAAVTH